MELVVLLMGLAAAVWFVAVIRYHDILTGTAIFLVATSVFPPLYVSVKLGGISATVDRVWLIALLTQFTYDLWNRRSRLRNLTASDVWLFLFLVWLTASALMTPIGREIPGQPPTLAHLINGYLIPAFLFCLIRHTNLQNRNVWPAITVVLLFGIYLSVTAIFEITKQWSFVFPSFIGDPKLGIHFGRARGPMLQSIQLGICLNLCLIALWVFPVWLYSHQRWAWMLAFTLTPLFLAAIFTTYTRSIWMGAAAILVILLATMLQGKIRTAVLGSILVFGIVGGLLIGPSLVAFKREYSEAETLESTRMRGAFAYVSWKMFQDSPITGFGFNQFQVNSKMYLDDRTTNIRLESIRGYVHHNSYLSLLVDLGLIGATLYMIAAVSLIRNSWIVWMHPMSSPMARSSSVFTFCVVVVHAIQMAFHEVTFSSIENTILMMALGMSQVYRDELIAMTERTNPSRQSDSNPTETGLRPARTVEAFGA